MLSPHQLPTIAALLALALWPESKAQAILPTDDPPASIKALARYTADQRHEKVGRKLNLPYRPETNVWKMVHACVQKDAGSIKAMKTSFSRQFKGAERDPWSAYALAIQAYHLHHAGEFPKHLRDSLVQYLQIWDRDIFARLKATQPFHEQLLHLPTASCAAAFLPKAQIPATHQFVRESLDHLRTAPPAELTHLNATLQSALLTGRIGEFKNQTWRQALNDLRDTVPPNGSIPARKLSHEYEDLFSDRGAALRIGSILFNDASYLYAADKYQVAAMTDAERPGRALSPIQWAYLSYQKLDAMAPAVPPSRNVVQRRPKDNTETLATLSLRTGNHPRAAFLLTNPGIAHNARSAPVEFWVGGSRLTPRSPAGAATHNIFLVTPSTVAFPAKTDAPKIYTDHEGLPMRCDTKKTMTANADGDATATLAFTNYIAGASKLTRRLVLTREGILVIADEFKGDPTTIEHEIGPLWNLSKGGALARGENWFAYKAYEHFLPHGYKGVPSSALVWFAPQEDASIAEINGTAYQKTSAGEKLKRFLTVVVPFKAELDPKAVAGAIKAKSLTSIEVGKVSIDLLGEDCKVSGNGR